MAAQPGAPGAVEVLAKNPDEPLLQGAVAFHLREILRANPELASEVAQFLAAAGPRANIQVGGNAAIAIGDGAMAANQGGIVSQGDVVINAPWPGRSGGV